MSELTVAEATESIYASLRADNADIDAHIATLKAAAREAHLRYSGWQTAGSAEHSQWRA